MWRRTKRVVLVLVGLFVVAAIGGAAYQSYASRKDLAATQPPGQLVDVGGHRLHIWCIGSGMPAVILDSGLGGTAFDWADVQPEVAKYTQVCSYDRAGMGYSDPGPTPRTSVRIANELLELLKRSSISTPVVLVGASFGGFNVRIFASEYSDRVAGLVLVDARHEDESARSAAAGLPPEEPWYAMLVPVAGSLGILRLMGITLGPPPAFTPPSVRSFVSATAYRTSRYATMANELIHAQESMAQVRQSRRLLSIPVIVLSAGRRPPGRGAEIQLELQRDQAKLSSRSCLVIAERSGHVIAHDQPELLVNSIRAVIDAGADTNSKPGC